MMRAGLGARAAPSTSERFRSGLVPLPVPAAFPVGRSPGAADRSARPQSPLAPGSRGTRRARCRGCLGTHVLLPEVVLLRCQDEIAVIGEAIEASVAGEGHRPIASRLGVPAGTVRGCAVSEPLIDRAVAFSTQR
jgi:hypothetical protein